jgi:LPS sulfotransferase NodH
MPERPYSGLKRAIRAYGPRLARPFVAPARRFVILTTGRTGSELLVSLLDSHPQIMCDGELLGTRRAYPGQLIESRTALAGLRGVQAYGFKLLRDHLLAHNIADPAGYLRRLVTRGFQVIVLERRDLLAQAVSYVRASGQGRYHFTAADRPAFEPERVDPMEVIAFMFSIEHAMGFARSTLAEVPHLTFYYEDDLADSCRQQATVERVCEYIGIPHAPVRSDLVRITPPALADQVLNFEELTRALAGTRYECWLNGVKRSPA